MMNRSKNLEQLSQDGCGADAVEANPQKADNEWKGEKKPDEARG